MNQLYLWCHLDLFNKFTYFGMAYFLNSFSDSALLYIDSLLANTGVDVQECNVNGYLILSIGYNSIIGTGGLLINGLIIPLLANISIIF